jgi:hypothetical protein
MRSFASLAILLILSAPQVLTPCFGEGEQAAPVQIDSALDSLLQVDPHQLVKRLAEMKAEAATCDTEVSRLRQEAQGLDARVAAIEGELSSLSQVCKAVQDLLNPQPPVQAEPVMMQAAAPSMQEPAPATEAKVTVSYEEHIRPIFASRCFRCHNQEKRRSGLLLETHAGVMEGGSSGPVIVPGQPDASRLLQLVSGKAEPKMPPSGESLDDAALGLIRSWIEQGVPANKDSKVMVADAKKAEQAPTFVAATFREGPPPMPETSLPGPADEAKRGVAGRALAASPRAPLVAAGGFKQVVLYNLETNACIGVLPFPEGDIYTLTFSVNGELLLGAGGKEGDSGKVVLWNVRTGERTAEFKEDYDIVLAADISPDHRLVAAGGPNRKVSVYSMVDGALLYKLDAHTDWIEAAKFSPDGELLATADRGGGLFLWQAANGRPVETFRGHEGAIHCLAFAQDSNVLASAGEDGTVQLWDTWKYSQIRKFKAHEGAVQSVEFTPDGQMVTTGVDRLTKRWDQNGSVLSTYSPLPDWGYRVCYSPVKSVVLAGAWNGEIHVWKPDTGELLAKLSTAPHLGKVDLAKSQ